VVDVLPGEGFDVSHLAKQICDPVRPTTQVPSGPGRRRWEFMLLEGENPRELEKPERIWELLSHAGVTPDNAAIERGVVYTFGAGWAQTWRADRVFLVGDAAHLMPPFAGQGMSSGLRDVLNLAWKLDLVLRGKAQDALLATYEPERVAHVNDNIQFSMMLAQVICITNPEIAAGRDGHMLAAIRDRVAPQPPPAPRLGEGIHIGEHGGELSWQGFVTTSDVAAPTRFDDVFGPGVLIMRGDASQNALSRPVADALVDAGIAVARFGGSESNFSDASGTYTQWFEEWGIEAVLIRPDFFVYGTAAAGEAQALADGYLSAVGAPAGLQA
jgi:3-(3-hydroxy-phenyl)propionate hydroxylase